MRDDDSDDQYGEHHDKDDDCCAATREETRVGLAQMISCGITSVISRARRHHQYFAQV